MGESIIDRVLDCPLMKSAEEESQANKGLIYPDGVGYKTPSTIGQPRERGGPKVSVGYGISPPIRKGRKIVYKKLHSKLGKKRKGAGGPDGVGWKTPSREMKEGRQMLQGTREQVDEENLVGVGQREQMTKTCLAQCPYGHLLAPMLDSVNAALSTSAQEANV
ncbi:hypothetical protein Fot_01265 [Forsythia ovata]|uniref:Uncharacterized protein n=1 Tax=Forsythia ovata TaxID=205694 RepID=A0ABD1X3G7_9LAMI